MCAETPVALVTSSSFALVINSGHGFSLNYPCDAERNLLAVGTCRAGQKLEVSLGLL